VFIPVMGHVMLTFYQQLISLRILLQNSALVKPAEIKITALNSNFYVLVRNHGMANAGCICRPVH
jgi:hypothetical protein